MSGMTPERLAMIESRIGWATEGPWAPWLDQDGQPHMHGLLMVGNADAVIPEGETWVEGVNVNPIAHTYTPEDRQFIAHARTDMPDLLAEVKRLRAGIEALRAHAHRTHDHGWGQLLDVVLRPEGESLADYVAMHEADSTGGGTNDR